MQLKFISTLLVVAGAVMTSATKTVTTGLTISDCTTAIGGFCVDHVAKAGLDLNDEICVNVDSCIYLKATGIIDVDIKAKLEQLSLKLKTAIGGSIDSTFQAKFNAQFYSSLNVQIKKILTKQCGSASDLKSCLKTNVKVIAKSVRKACDSAVLKICDDIKAQLQVTLSTAIDLSVRDFSINLLIEKITVSGTLDLKAKATSEIDAWAKLWIKDSAWDKVLTKQILQLAA